MTTTINEQQKATSVIDLSFEDIRKEPVHTCCNFLPLLSSFKTFILFTQKIQNVFNSAAALSLKTFLHQQGKSLL